MGRANVAGGDNIGFEAPGRALFDGVYTDSNGRLYTENQVRGVSVYGEARVTDSRGIEYRHWHPRRSKLAAMIAQGATQFPITPQSHVLYLGAANGTTVSHVSDIVSDGIVYAVEFSNRAFRKLLTIAEERSNIIPILHDARHPHGYRARVGRVDVIVQDIAQRDQAQILLTNAQWFLRAGARAILMVKARSIDVTAAPSKVFRQVETAVTSDPNIGLDLVETIALGPLERDHEALILKKVENEA